MTPRWIVMAVLCAAPAAFAQAPGEVPAAPSAPASDPVMATRWAVGLAVGGLSLSDQGQPQTGFGIGELAVRFRATLHLELELALAAGNSSGGAGMPAYQLRDGVLDLRYRIAPGRAWNGWIEGGLGALGQLPQGGTLAPSPSGPSQSVERPLGELGAGLERRFGAFALDARLRAYAIGRAKVDPPPSPGPVTPMPVATIGAPASAAELTLGATYYF